MAAAFTRRALAARGSATTVSSSGLVVEGRPPPDEVIELMDARGLDVHEHRSRLLDAEIVASADLLVGMERRHLTEIVAIDAEAYRRSFTLPEFVHRLGGFEPSPELRLGTVLDAIAQDRGRREFLRVSVDDEIPDPMGHSGRFFERVADEIAGLVDQMVGVLWAEAEPTPTGAH